ncbi:MAG: dihydroorotase [Xanthomonadaceae bacterium]|nr:dihydroorotase [Xanthomonadaceae bacterium]
MSTSFLIQNAWIIDPVKKKEFEGDLLIESGKLSAIDVPGKIPQTKAEKIINAQGIWLMPGLIDVHVHLREPGFERKETIETGTLAAVAGGFTSVACMANTDPVNDTAAITAFIRKRSKETGKCKVFPIGAVTKGLRGEILAELEGMVKEGAIALSDDGMPVMNSLVMRRAMEKAKSLGITVISHAEDANLVAGGVMNEGILSRELGLKGNPAASEEIMVAREIALSRLTKCAVHIAHISTREGIEHVKRAKEAGLQVTAEATPHHLMFNEQEMRAKNTNFKMAPPLRSDEDVQALREALASGLVDMIATDHAPHGVNDKNVDFEKAANGIVGLQTAVPSTLKLVFDGIVSKTRWVESLTTAPAKMIGQKIGTLTIGGDADITLISPNKKWNLRAEDIQSKSANSPFIGKEFQGKIFATIVQGKMVYQNV